jgi:hypothetical protein
MMPQALAAVSLQMTMPRILARFGYRVVLISNTVILGIQQALLVLGAATVASTLVFGGLRRNDGDAVSQQGRAACGIKDCPAGRFLIRAVVASYNSAVNLAD